MTQDRPLFLIGIDPAIDHGSTRTSRTSQEFRYDSRWAMGACTATNFTTDDFQATPPMVDYIPRRLQIPIYQPDIQWIMDMCKRGMWILIALGVLMMLLAADIVGVI